MIKTFGMLFRSSILTTYIKIKIIGAKSPIRYIYQKVNMAAKLKNLL